MYRQFIYEQKQLLLQKDAVSYCPSVMPMVNKLKLLFAKAIYVLMSALKHNANPSQCSNMSSDLYCHDC